MLVICLVLPAELDLIFVTMLILHCSMAIVSFVFSSSGFSSLRFL